VRVAIADMNKAAADATAAEIKASGGDGVAMDDRRKAVNDGVAGSRRFRRRRHLISNAGTDRASLRNHLRDWKMLAIHVDGAF
jgi:3-hydroxybutyrate dehydrogenase